MASPKSFRSTSSSSTTCAHPHRRGHQVAPPSNDVLFEADDHNVAEGWSVIVKGTARLLRTDDEIVEAERAELLPWTATVKQHFIRIRPLSVTGRRVQFGTEPDREFD